MSKNEIPEYIQSLRTDLGFDFVDLYQQGQRVIATVSPEQYSYVLELTKARVEQDYQAGKLDLITASTIFLTVLQLSNEVEDLESQIITLCNLGIMYQNSRAYDVALTFAAEAIKIAHKHNLLEMKLKALQVVSLVYTNTSESQKHIDVLEEVAKIYGKLGQLDKKAEIEAQIKQFKEFMAILGRS
ncbi:MAG: hypothetical protein JW779_07990 [Candidatus Thorarchaeota archaeon]|nr:hypothetical protein [Candidatus Thorarchaeota archaeon]